MEGNFSGKNQAAASNNASVVADASCSASVVSVASSAASIGSAGQGLRPVVTTVPSSNSNLLPQTATMDDASILSGEQPHSPTTREAGSGEGKPSGTVKRVNPFEQVDSIEQAESITSVSILGTEQLAAGQSNVPLSSSASDSASSHATPDHPSSSAPLQQHSSRSMPGVVQSSYPYEDDEDTEPSSAVNSADPADPGSVEDDSQRGSISRLIDSARKVIGGSTRKDDADEKEMDSDVDDDVLMGQNSPPGTLICGYLQKLGRNGKWQTRWFEVDGECLTYYKSDKRIKLLATLDLEKVGAITVDPEDSAGVSFTIQVMGRLYHLRTDSKSSCKDWVITLNRVKEAKMQQGNVKLVDPSYQQPVDLLDSGMPAQSDDFVAPRVVVLANRQRTKAVEEEQELNQLIRIDADGSEQDSRASRKSEKRLSTLGTVVLARWTKRRSSISRLRSKFAKWAQSIRKLGCSSEEAVGLDGHVHPPGHDDKHKSKAAASRTQSTSQKKKEGLSSWIGKEASISTRSPATSAMMPAAEGNAPARPRKMSSASDADIRVLS